MCVCAGCQGASRGARGLRRSAHSWQQERSGPQAPCKPAAHPPSAGSTLQAHSCHLVRAEARPDPRFSAPGWNQGLQEAWPSVSRVHGDQRAGHLPQPVLGGQPNPRTEMGTPIPRGHGRSQARRWDRSRALLDVTTWEPHLSWNVPASAELPLHGVGRRLVGWRLRGLMGHMPQGPHSWACLQDPSPSITCEAESGSLPSRNSAPGRSVDVRGSTGPALPRTGAR